ncbi:MULTISPECIES: hypothetical protein [unclassified Pseudoalteromonas]|uniref:hypothetical protein n=1 Tax=unclassified Pseudoalteromonas TaxID=194690 RepID=UPI0025B33298|nr:MULTISPECIES: hypothetical protein [unclassified Pseudoalteromonas]MDN3378273.1 hypothetical protein [Pseudoalteromonas sp. APC 3893]MDN3386193.1 hypothetical protein [Pseudoalteromonas sp. APC 4017]
MIKNTLLSCLGLMALHCNAQQKVSVYADSNSFSNISPVLAVVDDDWQSPPQPDADKGFSQTKLGISYQHSSLEGFTFHIEQRLDYFVKSHADTALGYYQEQNNIPLLDKENYKVKLDYFANRSKGFAAGYSYEFSDALLIGIKGSYWRVNYFRHSVVSGNVQGRADNSLLGDLNYEEYYTHNNFLKRPNEGNWDSKGKGYSVDLFAEMNVLDNLTVRADLIDIYNRFSVDNVGYTSADINTKGSFIDNQGFNSFRPLLKGFEGQSKHKFKIPEQIALAFTYHHEKIDYALNLSRQGDINFMQIGAQFAYKKGKFALMLDPINLTPQLGYEIDFFKLEMAMDKLNPNKAMQLSLNMQVNWLF